MADTATRVVLLARPGEACNRLGAALREAGAVVALVADPVTADPDDVLGAKPQAVLVALDAAVEDALERHDALLSDPGITVIFDEAELAAHREGWDAARWTRHLAAKLHRHDDVLPPGAEAQTDWPDPGPLPPPRAEMGELDIAAFTGEALERAVDVPRDDGFDSADGDAAPDDEEADDAPALAIDTPGIVAAEDMDWSASSEFSATLDADELDALTVDSVSFETTRDDDDNVRDDGVAFNLSTEGDDMSSPLEAFDGMDASSASDTGNAVAHADSAPAPGTFGDRLSLADDDAPIASPAAGGHRVDRDLDELDRRLEGLSLADTDSYGHGPLRGAVLVEAGLGGPDAVRQLLADIPESFPRAILVRLQLDGGRYDKLVKQMSRASKLPVAVAVAEQPADAGTIYVLPPTMTVLRDRARLVFAEADADHATHALYAELPPGDSAMLFLSGSSPALVDIAMAQSPDGALVAAQSPETCYDGAAPSALIALGGASATPAELAVRLAERWPS